MKRYIWTFTGPTAHGTAEHHAEHLREFLERNKLEGCDAGFELLGENHAKAWLTAPEPVQKGIERALRPPKSEPVE